MINTTKNLNNKPIFIIESNKFNKAVFKNYEKQKEIREELKKAEGRLNLKIG